MSDERTPVIVKGTPIKSAKDLENERSTPSTANVAGSQPDQLKPQAEAQETLRRGMSPEEKAQRRAKLVSVLERGVVHDRLKVELPPDMHGEWVRNDPLEIQRMETLGFAIDTEFAVKRALHSEGDRKAIVGDVVFMVTDRENKEIIDEIRQDQFYRTNGRPGEDSTKEEKEFAETNRRGTGGDIGTAIESKTRVARKSEIEEALSKINRQLTPQ